MVKDVVIFRIKYPYPPQGRSLESFTKEERGGRGGLNQKFFRRSGMIIFLNDMHNLTFNCIQACCGYIFGRELKGNLQARKQLGPFIVSVTHCQHSQNFSPLSEHLKQAKYDVFKFDCRHHIKSIKINQIKSFVIRLSIFTNHFIYF